MQIFVMPAWIAGIQVRKDASGDIHVNLDSSTPCWNDAIEGFCLKLTEAPPPRIFEGGRKGHEDRIRERVSNLQKNGFFLLAAVCLRGDSIFVLVAALPR